MPCLSWPRLLDRSFAVLLAFTLCAPLARSSDWPQFMRSDAHTGGAAEESLKLPLGLATCA